MPGLLIPAYIAAGFLAGASAVAPSRKGLSLLPRRPPSPIRGVLILSWTRFVTAMARQPSRSISPRARYGMFGMDMRRLSDVGFATKPRKGERNGECGVWIGDWTAPLSEKRYIASKPAQYESFKRSMVKLVPFAQKHVGAKVDGIACSLSGLLGVGHHAGEAGIESWVKNSEVRKKFNATTQTFKLVNGIF